MSNSKMQIDKTRIKTEFRQRLYNFTLKLIEFIDKLPRENTSRRLGDQLLHSGTSVIGNYVDGQSASSKKDFANYLNTCLKSCNESKLWLALLRDSSRVKSTDTEWFLTELEEFSRIFASSIITLRKSK